MIGSQPFIGSVIESARISMRCAARPHAAEAALLTLRGVPYNPIHMCPVLLTVTFKETSDAWSNQGGGGPWGSGGGKGPWGSGPQPTEGRRRTNGSGGTFIRRGQDKLRTVLPGGNLGGTGFALIGLAAVVIWGLLGFFTISPSEYGAVLRFGRYVRDATPGSIITCPIRSSLC